MKHIKVFVLIVIILVFASVNNYGALVYGAVNNRIQPSYLTYLGAFRLPGGTVEPNTWAWGGSAMTYYPSGDPGGPSDGYTGSIYGAGHDQFHRVSEISIPVPVISASKSLTALNTASTLQSFRDILDVSSLEIPRTGLAYLPKQGSQTTDKIHFCWGYHMQEDPPNLTHGWCELNLSNPQIKRSWYLGGHPMYTQNMSTNDYIFDIPTAWANANTPGNLLATGRFRDGGWGGQGPSLFAIGPWNDGNPPANGTAIQNTTLLLYTSTYTNPEVNYTMNNYHNSDEWSGAAWLTAGSNSAVIFVGTKGTGYCWYGNPSGPCLT